MTNTNFINYLKNTAPDYALLNAWAEYLDDTNNPDDAIFDMDIFDDIMVDKTPTEIVNSIANNFNTGHNYFQFNGYGYAVSSDRINDFIDFEGLAEFLEENVRELFLDYQDYCEE